MTPLRIDCTLTKNTDAAIYNPASRGLPYGREPAILSFGGHAAARSILASRGLPHDGPRALGTIPEESSSNSDAEDPCAGDSSDSPGCSELRYDESLDGCFTRGDFINNYGHIDGVARR